MEGRRIKGRGHLGRGGTMTTESYRKRMAPGPRGRIAAGNLRDDLRADRATGLRRSEALHLRCSDVDLDGAFLTARNTKFRKSRHVPIHATVVAELRRYLAVRARHGALTEDSPYFCLRRADSSPSGGSVRFSRSFAPTLVGPRGAAMARCAFTTCATLSFVVVSSSGTNMAPISITPWRRSRLTSATPRSPIPIGILPASRN
ncbi:MAG: hypothetical protein EOR33_33005 [Mesorhizobium sp.]|nr:MAG: hypothetical protein EOR33_33005 [Mesorhizobium sp.]TIO74043.1 MAG: hypothetical protein E5X75_25575 [Mesorhizobium sp.]